MSRLKALTREEVASTNQQIFDKLSSAMGRVPNLYATYANSPVALKANLELGETLKSGSFNAREVEGIALAIAEANGCDYCLAAHTAVGRKVGLTESEIVQIRAGDITDPKLRSLTDLAREIITSRGRPSEEILNRFYGAGYNDSALVELIGFVALNTFNNYLNHIADTEVDFPAVPELAAA